MTQEHQLKGKKRSDFTATKIISGKRRLLVTEVKGQWHVDLYTAASTQLHERYSIHPDAEQQGIFLAIWFSKNEKVAGRKRHGIGSAQELKCSIEARLTKNSRDLLMCSFWMCPSQNRTICHDGITSSFDGQVLQWHIINVRFWQSIPDIQVSIRTTLLLIS